MNQTIIFNHTFLFYAFFIVYFEKFESFYTFYFRAVHFLYVCKHYLVFCPLFCEYLFVGTMSHLILHWLPAIPIQKITITLFVQGGSTRFLVFFYPHFSCVRARDLKFYDFLNYIKTNLVKIFFCQKVHFCGHRALAKYGQKKPRSFLEPKIKKDTFFLFDTN